MRLISWNVNGIRAVAKKGFLETVAELDPDVLCIQETKASVDQLDESLLNIPGYTSYFSSAERKGYSGTAVYTKREPVSVSYGLGTDEFDHEGRTIELDFGDFILYNIYFPNGGQGPERVDFKLRFYDCFLDKVKKQMDEGRMVLVCGDVNTATQVIFPLQREKDIPEQPCIPSANRSRFPMASAPMNLTMRGERSNWISATSSSTTSISQTADKARREWILSSASTIASLIK